MHKTIEINSMKSFYINKNLPFIIYKVICQPIFAKYKGVRIAVTVSYRATVSLGVARVKARKERS